MKRILICGPIFDSPSGPSGQGGKLYTKLKEEGYTVYKRSKYRNKFLRVLDTLSFVLFNSGKYDVVFIQMFSNMAFIIDFFVVNLAYALNKKIVPVIRGGAFIEFYNKYPKWVGNVLKKATIVTSPSHFIGAHLSSKGIPVTQVSNFIEVEKFPYKWQVNDGKKLLWVRAFEDIYKPELAITSIHKLKADYPDIHLSMVGQDMGKLAYCKSLINDLDLSENITITGRISNDELSNYYTNHNIYINTTSYESFGVALVEAACSGIPIVTTEVGEIPYLWVNNEDMLMVADKDEAAFVAKIKALIEDQDLQNKLSKNARSKAEKFSWDNIKVQWNAILN